MNPNARDLWKGPRWGLALLLALLGMLGPFSIDAYLPAFAGIGQALDATPVQMQQTLSAYLFGFAFMSLFHGAISDSVGRRPVVLWGLAAFTLASMGCALSQTIGQLVFFRAVQGLTTGAGIVVSRAVVRDMFEPAQAQKVMSQITLFFGVAPAIAPLIGGWLFAALGWHSVFWFLTLVGLGLWWVNYRHLPESLHIAQRQPLALSNLMQGYWQLGRDPRFLLLALAGAVPFNGMFLYVMSAPVFLGEHLGLAPTDFFWFFSLVVSGVMAGAWLSGRMAGRLPPKEQIRRGFLVMLVISVVNVLATATLPMSPWWAMWPITLYTLGWAAMVPSITLLVLDLYPQRRGMASSLQAFVSSTINGLVAGVMAPLVMHSVMGLAWGSAVMMIAGLLSWIALHKRWPDVGRTNQYTVL